MSLRFAEAWPLAFLLPSLLLWALIWRHQRRDGDGGAALRFPSLAGVAPLRRSWRLRLLRPLAALRPLILLLLALALLRPQLGHRDRTLWRHGVDIMLAVDTSGSMQALDLDADRAIDRRRNRLEVVRQVMHDFIQRRENDQLGLVVFGTHAFTQCPLTLDHAMLTGLMDRVRIGVAGDSTALGMGLAAAVQRLQKSRAKSRVVVLLTDGSNNAGSISPQQAAQIARALKVKVYTVGAGTQGKAPFLVDTVFGKQVSQIDADLDEATLKEIASLTGGAYFRAEDGQALARVYQQIDALERHDIAMQASMRWDEAFSWLVLPALILLLLEIGLRLGPLRRLP